jgi:hypothetical protein
VGRKEGDISAVIFGSGFICEGGGGTWTQDPCLDLQDRWPHTLDVAHIDGERLFFTQPTQLTAVYIDADEEALGLT